MDKTEYRKKVIFDLVSKMNHKSIPDCQIPVYIGDSYGWEDDNIHFCWSKPYGKKGLLFPSWEFIDWESTKKKFNDEYIPWTKRERGPYFIGVDNSDKKSNIRKIIRDLYPENFRLLKKDETYREPPTNLMKYKTVFELPGNTPWSGRSVVVALSGSSSIRIHHYYPKWDEGPWFQFFEDPTEFDGINLEGNYNNPFPSDKIPLLKDAIDDEIAKALRRHATAKSIRERMMKLTTDHMVKYLEYIFTEVGKRQNL